MNDLVADIDELLELEFQAKWDLIEVYHKIGTRILGEGGDSSSHCARLALKLNRSKRTFQYAVKFAKMYPKLDSSLPEGKNITWNKLITKHLTEPKEIGEHIHDFKMRCICGALDD